MTRQRCALGRAAVARRARQSLWSPPWASSPTATTRSSPQRCGRRRPRRRRRIHLRQPQPVRPHRGPRHLPLRLRRGPTQALRHRRRCCSFLPPGPLRPRKRWPPDRQRIRGRGFLPGGGRWACARDVDSRGAAGEGAVREQQARLLSRRGHCGRQAVQYRRAGHRGVREEGLSTVARHLPDGNYSLRFKLQIIPRILKSQSFSNLIKFI